MSHYPESFPTEEAQHLYAMASTGTLRDNIAHAAHDAWWVQGFLQKFAIGEPDNHGATLDADSAAEEVKNACTEEEYKQLQELSVLAGITPDALTLPGEEPGGILDKIDINKLIASIQTIIALLQALKII